MGALSAEIRELTTRLEEAERRSEDPPRDAARGVQHGFKKVTFDIAADNEAAIRMFRDLGFQPDALLCDHLCDEHGDLHDLVILAHAVDEQWSRMLTAGMDGAVG